MKKFTLLLCLFVVSVMMPQWTMADEPVTPSITISDGTLTVRSDAAGWLAEQQKTPEMKACTEIVLIGQFNASDLESIKYNNSDGTEGYPGFNAVNEVDMSDATFAYAASGSNYHLYSGSYPVGGTPTGGLQIIENVSGLYQSVQKTVWTTVTLDNEWNANNNYPTYTDLEAVRLSSQLWANAKCLNTTNPYKYCKWKSPWKMVGSTNSVEDLTVSDYQDKTSEAEENLNNYTASTIGAEKVFVFRYYKLKGGVWVLCSQSDWNAAREDENVACFIAGEDDAGQASLANLQDNNWFGNGACIRFTIYYDWQGSEWDEGTTPTYDEQSNALEGDFHYAFKADHLNDYKDDYMSDIWVKMPNYDYYQLRNVDPAEYEWKPISFSNGDSYRIDLFIATGTSLPAVSSGGQYLVVCSNTTNDKKIYNGSTWVAYDGSTPVNVTGYGPMKFSYWKETVTSVILPNNIVASVCAEDIFAECSLVTSVKSGDVTATIDRSGSVYADISAPNDEEFERVRDILGLRNYVTDIRRVRNVITLTGEIDSQALSLTGSYEYIVLPAGVPQDVILNADYSHLPNLRAVISSSTSSDALVAHVVVAGSLYEARSLISGKVSETNLNPIPNSTQLKSVTLSGNLNASDIAVTNGDLRGLYEERSVEHYDLTNAVFANPNDMNFYSSGSTETNSIKSIKLPVTGTVIPTDCFRNLKSIDPGEICIPYSYEVFGDRAFMDSKITHITTTDAPINGAVIDNGEHTYTFSANLKSIGSQCFHLDGEWVRDVYVLATNVPICAKGAFREGIYYGDGGMNNNINVYCRDRYIKEDLAITVLHIPDQPAGMSDADYAAMKAKYTDVTKVYTKKDQTGALDANGQPIPWPTRKEMNRSYKQATNGYLWDEWDTDLDAQGEIETMEKPYDMPDKSASNDCTFKDYIGWHQFALCYATYVPQEEEVVDEKIIREYEEGDWYTFCIPFDMTEDEVLDWMGVRASTSKVYNYIGERDDEDDTQNKVTGNLMPKIYTLKSVDRVLSGSNGTINLTLSKNLANKVGDNYQYYNSSTGLYENNTATSEEEGARGKIVLRGGYPYLIKPYIRMIDGEKEVIPNLGEMVMKRYEFPMIASSIYRTGCFINQGGSYPDYDPDGKPRIENGEPKMISCYVSPFAKPYEGHKVQALFDDGKTDETSNKGNAFYMDGATKVNYEYKFMGQYWEQSLPKNSYYLAQNNWWYYRNKNNNLNYKWKRYHCIINVSSQEDNVNSSYYTQIGIDAQNHAIFSGQLALVYTNGHDDSFVKNENVDPSAGSRAEGVRSIRIVFDDMITEYDDEGNEVTAIQKLDGQDIMLMKTGKVYNMEGQYVGTSLDGLKKGLYIVNGKKIVVD